jgi:lysyl-tRNA synthetase class 1
VFEREPPLNVAYEFLNVGGRKMSTSKGRGAAAHHIAEVVPPEQLRFLFVRPRPSHAIDFDPDGTDQIPRLFDEFDRFAAATAGREVRGELPPGHEATFRYSLVDPGADVAAEAEAYRPPFAHLALLVQVPGVEVAERVRAEKGDRLTDRELAIIAERTAAARAWLESYAPERSVIAVQPDVPAAVDELEPEQRGYLGALAEAAREVRPASGDAWQAAIFDTAAACGLQAGRAFAAIYAAFLGRANGPRAGWLLSSLDPEMVVRRLAAAAGSDR